MTEPGPSTRFRAASLTILAAVGVILLIVLLAAGSFGLLPTPAAQDTGGPDVANDPALLATYGASGVVPQSTELTVANVVAQAPGAIRQAEVEAGIPEGELEIPDVALAAYQHVEEALALEQPNCHLRWTLVAGLGQVISGHAVGNLDADGTTTDPILGPRLDGGAGLARIVDTDQGRLDGDPQWDRAVGPMQLISTVWKRLAADANADGVATPHNIHDAALAAGRYLCEGGADLQELTEQAYSVFRYQRSESFVRAVLAWSGAYAERFAEPEDVDEPEEAEAEAELAPPPVVTTTQAPPPRVVPRTPTPSPTPRAPSPSPTSVLVPTTASPPPASPGEPVDPTEPVDPVSPSEPGDPESGDHQSR